MSGTQKHNDISEDSARDVLHVSFIYRSIIELYLFVRTLPFANEYVSVEGKARNKLACNPVNETTRTTYVTIPIPEQKVKEDRYLRKILAQYGLDLVLKRGNWNFS